MRLGFSYIGLIYLILLYVPNIIWVKHQPKDYELYVKNENKALLFMERTGEILATCTALIFSDFNLRKWTAWCWWLVISFSLMVLYEISWVRYFRSGKTMRDFYGRLLFIRIPLASLPVAAFFLLGIYGSNLVMILTSIILGIGHIGIHTAHEEEVFGERKKPHGLIRVGKGFLITLLILLFGIISVVIGMRNVRYIKHYVNLFRGVDEQSYITLGGQEQYVLMTGRDVKNPVIIYLHGGPSSPDAFCTYAFADHLTEDFTFVCWDQRGCGRTYYENEDTDPSNETASFDRALEDLDELVDYARERFGQERVIIMGHSYGTILGSTYVQAHPEKVSAYIGIAQVISPEKSERAGYEMARIRGHEKGKDTTALEKAYQAFEREKSLPNRMALRREVMKLLPVKKPDQAFWNAVFSPYFGMDDLNWFLVQTGDEEEYYRLNRQLFDATFSFDIDHLKQDYEVPVHFISGGDDRICPVDPIRNYKDRITAPKKTFTELDGCGHNVQYTEPEAFADTVKQLLK